MQEQTESTLITYRLAAIEDQLSDLKTDMNDITVKTNQLVDALIGNKLTHSAGLSERVDKIEKKQGEHEEILKKVRWFWLGVVTFGGIVGLLIDLCIRFFFSK